MVSFDYKNHYIYKEKNFMKKVTLTTNFWKEGETDTGFLIKNLSDLILYIEHQSGLLVNDFIYACKKNIRKEQWDHFYSSSLGIGTTFAKMKGTSPIFEATNLLDTKSAGMAKVLLQFGAVFVNQNGGYHNFNSETHTILEEKDVNLDRPQLTVIANRPSLINLENDADIENHTVKYFKENGLELSYICHLRNYSQKDLVNVFTDFKNKGGTGLYVYTTGMDINQMEGYCNAAIDAGLDTILIQFNVQISDNHIELLDGITDIDIKYEKI
jgi:hypothetical protein